MQQIERYGVIALVFLLVTIVAVSFWGDSKSPGFWSRLTGRGAKKDANSAQVSNMIPPATSTERAIDPSLPLTTAPGFESHAGAPTAWPAESVPGRSGTTQAVPSGPVTPLMNDPWTTPPAPPSEIANHPDPWPASQPAPASRTAPAPIVNGPQYVVQKGDSLIRIASKTLGSGSRWTEIQALNGGLEPRSLKPGMKLALPPSAKLPRAGSAPAGKPAQPALTPVKSNGAGTYVVRAGDTLSGIASRLLGDGDRWREILKANAGLDPKRLFVGKSLRVPANQAGRSARAPELAAAAPRSDRSAVSDRSDRPRVR